MRHRYVMVDVFSDHPFGGNPLAVFPEAEDLLAGQMQTIAAELNLSETVFVLPPEDGANTRRLRIFTPRAELPFAGHPTIGVTHVLAEVGEVPLEGGSAHVVFE
jgi:trans-2,3-dihydro-3-hydroxyanthranilate isomerase